MPNVGLVWFRNDLRVADHEPLLHALKRHDCVVPVYVFDPRILQGRSRVGLLPRFSGHRFAFLDGSLRDLAHSLESLGGKLVKRIGEPETIIPLLCKEFGVSGVYFHEEAATEERVVESELKKALSVTGVSVQSTWNSTLAHRDDLPFSGLEALPHVFTSFRVAVEKACEWRKPLPPPTQIAVPENLVAAPWPKAEDFGLTLPQPEPRSAVLTLQPGETGAWKRLDDYVWESQNITTYKETRNGLVGLDYSSKFSAHLAHGCITPRCIAAEVARFEREVMKNDSTYWLIFELLWRDYFRFIALKHGSTLFRSGGIQGKNLPTTPNNKLFDAWKTGQTGVPFVDANMRELALTGFMSNRGRQNVASYLVRNIKQHWRLGAEHFETYLIDYDPCSNWGNWNYAAGVGNDPREDRMFNIDGQAKRYDASGDYTRLWVPELKSIPKKGN